MFYFILREDKKPALPPAFWRLATWQNVTVTRQKGRELQSDQQKGRPLATAPI